jgi:hypothetical protein
MKLVIVESPYAGDVTANVAYARQCMHHCLSRNEAPYASHLLYTQEGVLDDDVVDQRLLGIEAGLAWGAVADLTAVYLDLGVSRGMIYGIERALKQGRPVELRVLHEALDEKGLMERLPLELRGRVALHQYAHREGYVHRRDHFDSAPRLLEALAKEGVADAEIAERSGDIVFRIQGREIYVYCYDVAIGLRPSNSLKWTTIPAASRASDVARAILDLLKT